MKISVIIPVFNTEKYLPQCLDSLLAQSYPNWEAILVDDGSSDGSGAVCDRYAREDSRFRVIHQENQGLSGARNAGLDASAGDYIAFLDSDDLLASGCLSNALDSMQSKGADLVIFGFSPFYEPDYRGAPREFPRLQPGIYSQNAFLDILTPPEDWVYSPTWCKLYPAECFRNLRFPLGVYHEDEAIFHRVLGQAETVAVIAEGLYHYRQRPGSIMAQDIHPEDLLDAYQDRLCYSVQKGWQSYAEKTASRIFHSYRRFSAMEGVSHSRLRQILRRCLPKLLRSPGLRPKQKIYLSLAAFLPGFQLFFRLISYHNRKNRG